MTTREFHRILHEYDEKMSQIGFKRDSPATYLFDDKFRLQFILDKWGWDEESGSAFVARLFDLRKPIGELKLIHPQDQLDVTPHHLIEHGFVQVGDIDALYLQEPKGVREYAAEGPWFAYYDVANLRSVLDTLLPYILQAVHAWRP